jgi:hypothetical protein
VKGELVESSIDLSSITPDGKDPGPSKELVSVEEDEDNH